MPSREASCDVSLVLFGRVWRAEFRQRERSRDSTESTLIVECLRRGIIRRFASQATYLLLGQLEERF